MDTNTSVAILERCKRLAAERNMLQFRLAKSGSNEQTMKELVSGLTQKIHAQDGLIERLTKELQEMKATNQEMAHRERYCQTELKRVLKSREIVQVEAYRLNQRLETAQEMVETVEEQIASVRKEERQKRAQMKAALEKQIREAKEREQKALSHAKAAQEELEELGRAPFEDLRRKVVKMEQSSKLPLEEAENIMRSANEKAVAAEQKCAKLLEELQLVRQQRELALREKLQVERKHDSRQALIDSLRMENSLLLKERNELNDATKQLREELDHQTGLCKRLEQQLRVIRYGET